MADMNAAFETLGAQIIDPDRFMAELMGDFEAELISKIRKTSAAAYQELMTDEEIAALADFYRSDAGQTLLARGLSEATLNEYNAFAREGAGAPILEHLHEIVATMEEMGPDVLARLKDLFSMARMADVMEMESVVKFEDESHRKVVVDALRKAG